MLLTQFVELVEEAGRLRESSEIGGELCSATQRVRQLIRGHCLRVHGTECGAGDVEHFAAEAQMRPPKIVGVGELGGRCGLAHPLREVEGGTDVVELGQKGGKGRRVAVAETWSREEVYEAIPVPPGRVVALPGGVELLGGELADHLEEREATFAVRSVGDGDQRLVDQASQ